MLALDLDNTLWGGVIGDDGQEGIEIGQETSMGQAYDELQRYLKEQKKLGVLLTVCSKNEPENALLGLNHPNGVLKPDDFVCIQANWDSKDQNILKTAQTLNLLPESFVFVDDNPAERAIVSGQIAGIAVPEFDSVEECLMVLDRSGYFEVTTLSKDDANRNEMYRANVQRAQLQQSFADYTEYLHSLDMHASITDFDPISMQRIVQLTNKSNQFNLTTRRYTKSDMEAVAASPNHIRLCGRLRDKFGDNGIVSVVIGEQIEQTLHIDLWLMSCRVLKRDMELAMLDELVAQCQALSTQKSRHSSQRKGDRSIMTHAEVLDALTNVFRDVFDDNSIVINDQTTANDIEDWDSLEHINLIEAVEKEFNMRFQMREVSGMKNVGEMVDIIIARAKPKKKKRGFFR